MEEKYKSSTKEVFSLLALKDVVKVVVLCWPFWLIIFGDILSYLFLLDGIIF